MPEQGSSLPAHDDGPEQEPIFSAFKTSAPVSVRIAELIADAIESGKLEIGSRMASEKDLALQFDVSRVTVREALSCLQFSGYVESRRGSGTVILSATPHRAGRTKTSRTQHASDVAQIIDVMESRLLVEPQVVRLVAEDASPAGMRRVRQMLGGMGLSLDSEKIHPRGDLRFHQALIRSCRNTHLVDAAEILLEKCSGPLWQSIQESTWVSGDLPKHWLRQHEQIVQAVRNHEPELAELASRNHLLSVLTNVASNAPLNAVQKSHITRIVSRHEKTL